jgi:hypothetical protein
MIERRPRALTAAALATLLAAPGFLLPSTGDARADDRPQGESGKAPPEVPPPPAGARAVLPWEAAPFAASPAAVLVAARAATAPAHVATLLEEGTFRFDAEGCCDHTYRHVYRLDDAATAESWSRISATYSPWHQERPRLRARVVTPDERFLDLDPRTLDDAPAADDARDVHGDRRVVRAPLPGGMGLCYGVPAPCRPAPATKRATPARISGPATTSRPRSVSRAIAASKARSSCS